MDLHGADVHSIDNLNTTFLLHKLPLNICYRCPENVIRLAQEIVPSISWNKEREDCGEVSLTSLNWVVENLKARRGYNRS